MATRGDHQPFSDQTEEHGHGERQGRWASPGGGHGLHGAAAPVPLLPGPSLRVPILAPVANPIAQHQHNVYPIVIYVANPVTQYQENMY